MPLPAPSVSAVLLAFNCREFIGDAVASVLAQDCPSMEVLISDDASTDGTYQVLVDAVRKYKGPHRVVLRRRSENSGSKSAHLNDAIPHSSGEIVVSFDGDDISEPHRVDRLLRAFTRDDGVQAVYSDFSLLRGDGSPGGRGRVPHPALGEDAARWFSRVDAYAAGTTLAFRRQLFELFGPLDPRVHEDVILPFRASLLGRVHYVDEPLVRVRLWAGSLTADQDRFESVDRYRARMLQGIEKAEQAMRSRLADLAEAERRMPHRREEFRDLGRMVETSMTHARTTAGLVDPSPRIRLRTLLDLLRAGAYRDELLQNAGLALAPKRYLQYKRWDLQRRISHPHPEQAGP
jgi:glycosyltransferase involved in cell wall biosynthesis